MRRTAFIIVVCVSLLLAACTPTAPAGQPTAQPPSPANTIAAPPPEKTFLLTAQNYPRVDGSTANIPLMANVLASAIGMPEEEAQSYAKASGTSHAYEALLGGQADLLLVYEPADVTKSMIEAHSTKLEFTPIGRDALVFIANERNPVNSLTQAQLKDIYTGRIKNWNEVGGEPVGIMAFQRPEASGSQALFVKLLMRQTVPMTAPVEQTIGEMGELIDKLAEYDNSGEALGYSVYYYAKNMYERPGLKMLSVDGIPPSNQTIADGSYPLTNDFYAVIRGSEPEFSPARILAAWLTTPEGKDCITQAGYVAVP